MDKTKSTKRMELLRGLPEWRDLETTQAALGHDT
jgi:hypothetical protein